jgi:flagellar hook assembly protein FlgD
VTVPYLHVSQNYPNPFNPSTTIRFVIGGPADVRLEIFDVKGALVRILVDESLDAGAYERTWDGFDGEGAKAVSGVYFCRITAGGSETTRKMVLLY